MPKINQNYLKLPGSYLFSDIAKRVALYKAEHPDQAVISLGIGDVTLPIAPAVTAAMHRAADEMADAATFHGYGPEQGYAFLRETLAQQQYISRGAPISADEIFISDGAKCDTGNFGELFDVDNTVAVCDPVYPVYVDTNAMAGRAGDFMPDGKWSKIYYMPCVKENGFIPEFPKEHVDIIYLCYPNNPTGVAITADRLKQWVDYALKTGSVILYDAAYEAFITGDLPHSIFEIEGARACAVEFRSFSKTAGFTGLRCAYTVIPRDLKIGGVSLHDMWSRRQTTKFNGVSYVTQCAAQAALSEEGHKQTMESIGYYLENAKIIKAGLSSAGYETYGGENGPYIWLKTPDSLTSWAFFDRLLGQAQVVGTPGSGFGPHGEGYFRLTGFGSRANTLEAVERIKTRI